ncbi:MAG TPA: isopentenyl transferase family protein, partial [Patescibacteria group bacterium]|nr:isopentenyl transferase family protein [Patescibacteria group bacterium]
MKIIAIVGPTATGKSALAVKIAKKIEGEIISADSRAVYRDMDIGADKVPGSWEADRIKGKAHRFFVYKSIRHHCIDFVAPQRVYSAADFVQDASAAVSEISARKKIPILCGGTGFWIDALTRPGLLADAPPSPKLRRMLGRKSLSELARQLKRLDPGRFETIDRKNKRRLI